MKTMGLTAAIPDHILLHQPCLPDMGLEAIIPRWWEHTQSRQTQLDVNQKTEEMERDILRKSDIPLLLQMSIVSASFFPSKGATTIRTAL